MRTFLATFLLVCFAFTAAAHVSADPLASDAEPAVALQKAKR